mgnify:CR=1 FL=1
MDLEEQIKLSVTLNIDKDVGEIVYQTIDSLMESNIKIIKNSFDNHPNMRNKIAGAKIEQLLVELQIRARDEKDEAADMWKANQEKIRSVDIETKEAYLHKRISEKASEALAKEKEKSPKVYTRDQIPYITQIPEEDAKRVEAKAALESVKKEA